MNEVKKRKFLSFEYKKIILPILLILLFSYQIILFYQIANTYNKFNCNSLEYYKEIKKARLQNDSLKLKQEIDKFKPISEKYNGFFEEMENKKIIFSLTRTIDPFFPTPCEMSQKDYCRHYITKETYDCNNQIISELSTEQLSALFKLDAIPYKKVSAILLISHLIILFIIGYLFSAIIFFILRNVRIKW